MPAMKSLPKLRAALALLLVLLLAGCGSAAPKAKVDTIREYANAVRWSDWDSAIKFIDPAARVQSTMTQDDLDRLKDVKVTGYEVKTRAPQDDGTIKQTVEIRYIDQNTQVERSKRVEETWRVDEGGKLWWLTSDLPEF